MAVQLPEASEFQIPNFAEYLKGAPPPPEKTAAVYAHPVDRAIIDRLSRTGLQHPINRLIELAMQWIFTPLKLNSVPVTSRAFPTINRIRARAASILGIPVPDVYAAAAMFSGLPPAFTVGTDEDNF